jgi:hypothetical protein
MRLVKRHNSIGARNHLYDNNRIELFSTLMEHPRDVIYADDHRVMHSVDPLRAAQPDRTAQRDMLIIDYDLRPDLATAR